MEKIKFNFDRKPLSEEAINAKQDFANVLKVVKVAPKLSWMKLGYYGTVGIAGIAATIGIFKLFQINDNANDVTATLNNQQIDFEDNYFETNNDASTVQLALNTIQEPILDDIQRPEQNTTFVAPIKSKTVSQKEMVADIQQIEETSENTSNVKVTDSIVEEEKNNYSKLPKISSIPEIAGVSKGNILWTEFKTNGILVDENQTVKQFSIQYTAKTGDRTVTVMGNKISSDIERELEDVGLNQKIFITNILSESPNNSMRRMYSMELDVLFK